MSGQEIVAMLKKGALNFLFLFIALTIGLPIYITGFGLWAVLRPFCALSRLLMFQPYSAFKELEEINPSSDWRDL